MPRKPTGRPPGRPKGVKLEKTLAKEQARELLRQIVTKEMKPLIDAQMSNAKGIKYIMARNKKGGTFKRLERLPKPGEEVGNDDEIIEVWAKDPSIQAFSDLMNRALDKPKEQEIDVNLTVWDSLAERINEGRKRAAKVRGGK